MIQIEQNTAFYNIASNRYNQGTEGLYREGEDIIARSPILSYLYAKNRLKKRFKKGEKAIATDPYWSYYYAMEVVKNRWKKGEKIIETSQYWRAYQLFVKSIKRRK